MNSKGRTSHSRHKKSLKTLLIVTLITLIPLSYLGYWHHQDNPKSLLIKASTPPFVWLTSPLGPQPTPHYLTHQTLLGAVHLAYFIPPKCSCQEETTTFKSLSQILDAELISAEKKSGLAPPTITLKRLLISAPTQKELLSTELITQEQSQNWYHIPHHPWVLEDLKKILSNIEKSSATSLSKEDLSLKRAFLLLWDHTGQISSYIPTEKLQSSHLSTLKRALSLVFFHGSMAQYLKERTFFGEKKSPNR